MLKNFRVFYEIALSSLRKNVSYIKEFPLRALFGNGGCGNRPLARVLKAVSRHHRSVGYCQGMNFVAASILLFVSAEDDAFWLLSHIVEEVLPDHYVQSMIGHTIDRQVTEQLVELHLPALSEHLRELGLSMPFITTQWFLCLFLNVRRHRSIQRPLGHHHPRPQSSHRPPNAPP